VRELTINLASEGKISDADIDTATLHLGFASYEHYVGADWWCFVGVVWPQSFSADEHICRVWTKMRRVAIGAGSISVDP